MNNLDDEKFSIAMLVVSKIQDKYGINSANFARIIGKNPTYVNDVKKGKTRRISDEIADKIIEQWPELSRIWLLTGEGSMLRQDNSSQSGSVGDNTGIIVQHGGGGDTYNNNQADLLELIKSQQRTIQALTEQNKVLTEIIKNRL